jgi:hypothetical protein
MTEHQNLATALAAFQAELPSIVKESTAKVTSDKGGFTYGYADLAAVSKVVLPLLGKHGLSFSSRPTLVEGKFALAYVLRHSCGDEDSGVYPLPTTGTPQQIGSAITYARRYSLMAVSGVFPQGEDDDGKAAGEAAPHWNEPRWDPVDQEMLVTGWLAEIDSAKSSDDLTNVGQRIGAQRTTGRLSPASYDHLARAGAARKAELFQEAELAAAP